MGKYKPLFIIVGLILFVSLLTGWGDGTLIMRNFMIGFFFVFAGFKLLDIHGFARGYQKYDLLAKHCYVYGLLYPFLELGLGTGYILMPDQPTLHIATACLMTFGGIGVALKIMKREQFQCACLGTFINVPLTAITIVENFGMAAMALWMLLMS